MGDEILRHPDPVVCDDELILPLVFCKGGDLPDPKAYRSALRRIFHRIGKQVYQNLLQAVLIRHHSFVPDMVGIDLQLLTLFRRQWPEHIHHILDHLRQGSLLGEKINLPAFDLGHVQNLVDEA